MFVAVALVFGGASSSGQPSDALLQLGALVIAGAALHRDLNDVPEDFYSAHWPARLGITAIIVASLALFPLPYDLWALLPGRTLATTSQEVANATPSWMPLSLSERGTWLTLLALLPAAAVFIAVRRMPNTERIALVVVIVKIAVVSVLLGLLQVGQGPDSALRFYSTTNKSEAVGFFANRNHFSALIYVSIVFGLALMTLAIPHVMPKSGRALADPRLIFVGVLAFVLIMVLVSGQLMARSRAGLALSAIAILGGCLIAVSLIRSSARNPIHKLVLVGCAVALLFGSQFALYRLGQRLDSDPLGDARVQFTRHTLEALTAYLPFGSGSGSFVPVYAAYEAPTTVIMGFANHAHNDLLEIVLELGIAGAVLLTAFAILWAKLSYAAWRGWRAVEDTQTAALQRSATLVIGLLAAHSLVDYPLRTPALSCIFAFACALLLPPPRGAPARPAASMRPSSSMKQSSENGRVSSNTVMSELKPWTSDAPWPIDWHRQPTAADQRTDPEAASREPTGSVTPRPRFES